jgi:ABC-type Fe3+/spermidine/putrescine transport system ATPase subunit
VDIDVELRGVAMSYGATPVLHSLDLEVYKGEFLSLLGPSGCGKTTTLNIIAGFLEPSRGTVTLGGRVVNEVPAYRRNTGMVFQSYALFPHMSVFDNVAFGLKVRRVGVSDIARRVRDALALVQLEGLEERAIRQLSGGQQQRVAIARALVGRPRLILADEPTGNLDSRASAYMMALLQELGDDGITVVLVTHEPDVAAHAVRVVTMRDGRIISDTTQVPVRAPPPAPAVAPEEEETAA